MDAHKITAEMCSAQTDFHALVDRATPDDPRRRNNRTRRSDKQTAAAHGLRLPQRPHPGPAGARADPLEHPDAAAGNGRTGYPALGAVASDLHSRIGFLMHAIAPPAPAGKGDPP